ncbi:MAG: YdeI/OmpD-associated family protein [Gemmatimonadaceae bacterium]
MGTRDPRVDAYVDRSADFAKPILTHFREVVHAACPDVEETMKWSFPHFMYEGMLCSMASFKQHCAFGFWKGALVVGDGSADAMGQFGRVTSIAELPPKRVIAGYVKQAMRLNEEGVKKTPARPRARKPELAVPDDLVAALKKNRTAQATFEGFPPSHRREYVEWLTEARSEETRKRRLATTIEWLAEGKQRNWKYMKSGR